VEDTGDVSVNRVPELVKTSLRVHHNKKVEEHCSNRLRLS